MSYETDTLVRSIVIVIIAFLILSFFGWMIGIHWGISLGGSIVLVVVIWLIIMLMNRAR